MRWAFRSLTVLAALAVASCGSGDGLPHGVEVSRSEAIAEFRATQDGHDINKIDARLVTWREYERARNRVDRAEGYPVESEQSRPDGIQGDDFVWVVGATGDFFNSDGFEYTQAIAVFDAVDAAEVEWGSFKGSGLPRLLSFLEDRA